jgi:DNA invertase Pin-like site-specific DNA recombinase
LMEQLLPLMGERRQRQIERALASYNPHLRRKLDPEQIAAIRAKLTEGHKHSDLAKQYGVDRSTISHIKAGIRRAYR